MAKRIKLKQTGRLKTKMVETDNGKVRVTRRMRTRGHPDDRTVRLEAEESSIERWQAERRLKRLLKLRRLRLTDTGAGK